MRLLLVSLAFTAIFAQSSDLFKHADKNQDLCFENPDFMPLDAAVEPDCPVCGNDELCFMDAMSGDVKCIRLPQPCLDAFDSGVTTPKVTATTGKATTTVSTTKTAGTTETTTTKPTTGTATTSATKADTTANQAGTTTANPAGATTAGKDAAPAATTTVTLGGPNGPVSPTATGDCTNVHQHCCFWASAGECDKNPFYMKVQCGQACGTCGCTVENAGTANAPCQTRIDETKCKPGLATGGNVGATNNNWPTNNNLPTNTNTWPHNSGVNTGIGVPGTGPQIDFSIDNSVQSGNVQTTSNATTGSCADSSSSCKFWAQNGECEKNPYWMKPNCASSCQSCGKTLADVNAPPPVPGCSNSHALCQFWKDKGECTANPAYMNKSCALSCGTCGSATYAA